MTLDALLGRYRALRPWFAMLPSRVAAERIVRDREHLVRSVDDQLLVELRRRVHWLASQTSHAPSLREDHDDAAALLALVERARLGEFPISRDHVEELLLWWDPDDRLTEGAAEDEHAAAVSVRYPGLDAERARTRAHAEAAGIWSERDPRIISSLLEADVDGTWLILPLYRPGRARPEFFRAKKTSTAGGNRARSKGYKQPEDVTGVYFPPITRASPALQDPSVMLVLTEGEKKALALDRLGYLAVGIPGVWGAGGGKHETPKRLHPWLREDVALRGRVVIIAFDSDVLTNPEVRDAIEWTRGLLIAQGAEPRVVDWAGVPHLPLTPKQGVDDLARVRGADAVHRLIGAAVPRLTMTSIRVPAAIASSALGPAQKIVYGALAARAREGRVENVTHEDLARVTRRSRRAVGQAIASLDAANVLDRTASIPSRTRMVGVYDEDEWRRDADSYALKHDQRGAFIEVDPVDLGMAAKARDTEALLLGVLRRHPDGLLRQELMVATGSSKSTIARALRRLKPNVQIRAGRIVMR